MAVSFTVTQRQRLAALGASGAEAEQSFADAPARDAAFRAIEAAHARLAEQRLRRLLSETRATETFRIEQALTEWLIAAEGFTRISTPTIISAAMLDKMTITEDNPLRDQVFWLDQNRCLRPMLAPNLYIVMRALRKITRAPVKIFEAGSCFRKESQGAEHMNEFTMLNLVEFAGTADGRQGERLEALAHAAMQAAGIVQYELVKEQSAVYGETLDIVAGGVEIASGSYGPHPLDGNWGVFEPWVGLGIGLERIALVKGGHRTIKRVGRSVAFLDGASLHV